ncbi:tyrosine-type recombinase/integrase [Streptomyces sp. NPDC052040]|uniref:tyrosine-type recombinase/integrase n=1 Tax=Streptomyces sp. NPDC052040 TaxID=3365682 RepID=UPI0037D05D35
MNAAKRKKGRNNGEDTSNRKRSERPQGQPGESGFVFTTPTGRPPDPANLTRCFRTFLDRAGLRRIRFHDFRHSTATLLREQGVDLVVIQGAVEPGPRVTAGVYAQVRLRLQRQAINRLAAALMEEGGGPEEPPPPSSVR